MSNQFFMVEYSGPNDSTTGIFVTMDKNGKLCHSTFDNGVKFVDEISAERFAGHVLFMINFFKSKPHRYKVRRCEIKEVKQS